MEQLLLTLSAAHVFVKFVKCKAGDALKNYPDSQCPTLLIYKGGSVLKQFIKFDSFGGPKATAEGKYPAVPSVISFTLVFSWLSQCSVCAGLVLCSCHLVLRRRCLSGVAGFVLTCLFCSRLVCSCRPSLSHGCGCWSHAMYHMRGVAVCLFRGCRR